MMILANTIPTVKIKLLNLFWKMTNVFIKINWEYLLHVKYLKY